MAERRPYSPRGLHTASALHSLPHSAPVNRSRPPQTQYTLKVVRVPRGVDEQDLTELCEQFGSVGVKINPGSEGNYAYLNFRSKQEAANAFAYLNGRLVSSERLKVKWRGISPSVQHVQSHRSAVGVCSPLDHMSHSQTTLSPHRQSPGISPSQPGSPTVKVLIQGKGITSQNLHDIFIQYGTIVGSIIIRPGTPDFAYINFSSPAEASQASLQRHFSLNGVTIFVKPSTKQPSSSSVKKSREFSDSDSLVNLLLATTYLREASHCVKPYEVIVKPVKDGSGLLISGNGEEVSLAECCLQHLGSKIRTAISAEIVQIHCKAIPAFANSTTIEMLATKRKLEFAVVEKGGEVVGLGKFGSTITSLSQGEKPMELVAFRKFLSDAETECSPIPSVSWEFTDNSGNFIAMPHSHSLTLEAMFRSNQSLTSCELSLGKWKYTYNFQCMTQTNIITKKIRAIRRVASGLGCYLNVQCRGLLQEVIAGKKELNSLLLQDMVKRTISLHQCSTKAEKALGDLARQYCVELQSSSPQEIIIEGVSGYIEKVALRLKEEALEFRNDADRTVSKFPFPPLWDLPAATLELKPVNQHGSEWRDVERKMLQSMATVSIVKIERIQNPWLWEKYAFCKQRMATKNHGVVNEEKLFHGTRETPPEKVYASEHGFDFRFGSNGMWGHGAYFAVQASYSARTFAYRNNSGLRQILLALVLTGVSVSLPSDRQLTKPPVKPTSSDQLALVDELYDSVRGHNAGSEMVIVYDHDKAYPAYLITFH